jgi:hypothetical protein
MPQHGGDCSQRANRQSHELPQIPERMKEEKVFVISLWTTKADAERYEKEFYPKVLNIVKPRQFVEALAA